MSKKTAAAKYHELTKYHPHTIGQGHTIDWQNPPEQCKTYAGADVFDMRPFLPSNEVRHFDPSDALQDPISTLGIPNLAKLLFATNGVTAVATGGHMERHYFRAAPSAGALYPTDLYVLIRNHPDLSEGVYYFHVKDHSLVEVFPKGFGPDGDELFARLQKACFDEHCVGAADIAIIATCVYWRSAWRYGERGYRRCLLDSGHVIGNLEIVGPRIGISSVGIGGFNDAEVGKLIDIIPEREGVLGVYPLFAQTDGSLSGEHPTPVRASVEKASESAETDPILAVHHAANIVTMDISEAPGELVKPPHRTFEGEGVLLAPSDKDLNEAIELSILRRRSARALTGEAITFEELSDLLAWSYRPDRVMDTVDQPSFFDRAMLDTYLVVQNVEGLTPGVYALDANRLALHLVREGVFIEEAHSFCLGQDLAKDAAVVLLHTANLDASTDQYGSRAYRYQHIDAGHLGERLNIAAMKLDLGASGIGGFFDDDVNELLQISDDEFCVYITVLGRRA
ncbi:SagB/ThcOx family dehydrogenase [Planctomycetota bacterium]|nr:SagB/ThcOx family dehydrogenase [Planctomycetota bacterium]